MLNSSDEPGYELSRDRPRGSTLGLVLGLSVSVVAHASFLGFILFLPSHLPLASLPVAYTVELVNADALGGRLPAGSVARKVAAPKAVPVKSKKTAERKAVEVKSKKTAASAPKKESKKAKPKPKKAKKIAAVKKPKVKKAAPKKVKAKPRKKVVKVAKAAPRPKAKKKTPPKKKASQGRASSKQSKKSPREQTPAGAKKQVAKKQKPGESAASLDSKIAAAIKRVEGKKAGPPSIGPGAGPGGGGLVRGAEFLVYYNAMLSRIKDSWTWVGTGPNLKVKVRFSIQENGTIVNLKLVRSSGNRGYDESVLRALRRVGRLDPPPARYRRDFSDVELEFMPGDLERRS